MAAEKIRALPSSQDLTPRQEQFIEALLVTDTIAEAARQAHISRRTATRWLKLAAIAARLKQEQRAVFAQAVGRLQGACADAAKLLHQTVTGAVEPNGARIRAAIAILDTATRGPVLVELEERITELQQALEQTQARRLL